MNRRAVLRSCVAMLLLVSMVRSEDLPAGFLDRSIEDDSGAHGYVVFQPTGEAPADGWPVIMFLHGSGQRGHDNRRQLRVGLGPVVQEHPEQFPAIVIFPQCDALSVLVGWMPDGENGKRALAILDRTMQEFPTNPDRVYLTGISMGGIGTWAHAMETPDRWAAIVPICGGGRTGKVDRIAHLPTWCFHGTADLTVPVGFSRTMIRAIQEAGGEPKFTEYRGVGHDSWEQAYAEPELWPWLFEQRRVLPSR